MFEEFFFKNRYFLLVLLVGLILAGGEGRAQAPARAPASRAALAPSAPPDGKQYADFGGRIEAVQTIQVRLPVPGLLTKICFREGQEVRQGELLFEVDPRAQQIALDLAQAELARAHADLKGAQAELERQKRLATTIRVPPGAGAEAAVRAAEVKVQSAKLNLESTRITAPISGHVGRANLSAGNWVLPGTVLTTIVSEDPIHVYFDMDQRSYLQFSHQRRQAGRAASAKPAIRVKVGLSTDKGFPHEGVVDFVDNKFDPKTGTILIRAVLPNADRQMLPGLFARVRMPLESPPAP